jgi:hypothetical protein
MPNRQNGPIDFAESESRDLGANGAESCRCATRPVLRTRPGHPGQGAYAAPLAGSIDFRTLQTFLFAGGLLT